MNPQTMEERRIKPSDRKKAHLHGFRLEFNKLGSDNTGKANIVPYPDGLVEGVLYEIDEESLKKPDVCEGYPENYLHLDAMVVLPDSGQEIQAITYIANPAKIKEGLKPTRTYLENLLAAKEFLSKYYYERLRNIETVDRMSGSVDHPTTNQVW